jgi:hypothetical protein
MGRITLIFLFIIILISSCNINENKEDYLINYWIEDYSKNDFPAINVDTFHSQNQFIIIDDIKVKKSTIDSISVLNLFDTIIILHNNLYCFIQASEIIQFNNKQISVTRMILSDNKWMNRAKTIFYSEDYGVLIQMYNWPNIKYLSMRYVYENNQLIEILHTKELIFKITNSQNLFPENGSVPNG